MLAAMEQVGNPSSVHSEGRAVKAIVEQARRQVAEAIGCKPSEVVFTSGATEAINLVFDQNWDVAACSSLEHSAVESRAEVWEYDLHDPERRLADHDGIYCAGFGQPRNGRGLFALTAAQAETGVLQPYEEVFCRFSTVFETAHCFCDATQIFTKAPFAFSWAHCDYASISAHKIGGPKGVGALILKEGLDIAPSVTGGGQEMGRRAGTENIIGIAGFGAAAEAAMRDLNDGVWEQVTELRNILENMLAESSKDTIFIGQGVKRLPNTSFFATTGWKGETQVMQMDLAGFAVSAGSACSSGKVRENRVLKAMGYPPEVASSALRVSLGPTTTEAEIRAFAEAWSKAHKKRSTRS